jgi:Opioid growth factor receptor (OGFr) conserved region
VGTKVEVSRPKADASMSRLVEFYRGTAPDAEGRTLANLWAFSDREMEAAHDFIQWMFPLREPSRFNPDAPLVTDADVAEFQADPALRDSLRRSFGRFLAFLGLVIEGGRVLGGADFARKSEVWRYPNHNWLRITRVLASLRMLGLEDEARAFFAFLESLRDGGTSGIDAGTFRYWKAASGPSTG